MKLQTPIQVMTLILNLPSEIEKRLRQKATELGLSIEDYALGVK